MNTLPKNLKIGDKIEIIRTKNGCKGAEGKVGIVTNRISNNGLFKSDEGFNVEVEQNVIWRINPDAKIEVLETSPIILSRDEIWDELRKDVSIFAVVFPNENQEGRIFDLKFETVRFVNEILTKSNVMFFER